MLLLFRNRSLDTAAGKERDDLTEMPQIVENNNNGDPDDKGKEAFRTSRNMARFVVVLVGPWFIRMSMSKEEKIPFAINS